MTSDPASKSPNLSFSILVALQTRTGPIATSARFSIIQNCQDAKQFKYEQMTLRSIAHRLQSNITFSACMIQTVAVNPQTGFSQMEMKK